MVHLNPSTAISINFLTPENCRISSCVAGGSNTALYENNLGLPIPTSN